MRAIAIADALVRSAHRGLGDEEEDHQRLRQWGQTQFAERKAMEADRKRRAEAIPCPVPRARALARAAFDKFDPVLENDSDPLAQWGREQLSGSRAEKAARDASAGRKEERKRVNREAVSRYLAGRFAEDPLPLPLGVATDVLASLGERQAVAEREAREREEGRKAVKAERAVKLVQTSERDVRHVAKVTEEVSGLGIADIESDESSGRKLLRTAELRDFLWRKGHIEEQLNAANCAANARAAHPRLVATRGRLPPRHLKYLEAHRAGRPPPRIAPEVVTRSSPR
eukprot:Hpha_TRINITY_DN15143_c3_g1::TRINITY_DN15143_c3_g1_i1::g.127539::m.127539